MEEQNIYAAPTATEMEAKPKAEGVMSPILALKDQSTWRLFFLTLITLGIYMAYYQLRQSRRLNEFLPADYQVPVGLSTATLIMAFVSVPFFFWTIFSDNAVVSSVSDWLDLAYNILTIVWAFKVRNRIHFLTEWKWGDPQRFKWGWTLIFAGLYVNRKVNVLCRAEEERVKASLTAEEAPSSTAP